MVDGGVTRQDGTLQISLAPVAFRQKQMGLLRVADDDDDVDGDDDDDDDVDDDDDDGLGGISPDFWSCRLSWLKE